MLSSLVPVSDALSAYALLHNSTHLTIHEVHFPDHIKPFTCSTASFEFETATSGGVQTIKLPNLSPTRGLSYYTTRDIRNALVAADPTSSWAVYYAGYLSIGNNTRSFTLRGSQEFNTVLGFPLDFVDTPISTYLNMEQGTWDHTRLLLRTGPMDSNPSKVFSLQRNGPNFTFNVLSGITGFVGEKLPSGIIPIDTTLRTASFPDVQLGYYLNNGNISTLSADSHSSLSLKVSTRRS